MSLHRTLVPVLLAVLALASEAASAGDGGIRLGFGEVPGYTAYNIAGQSYIDVAAAASSRFDRTWVFIEGHPMSQQLHVARIFSASGLLDTGFGPGMDGRRSVTLPAPLAGPAVNGAIAQDDGMVLAYGRLREAIDGDYAGFICRFTASGALHAAYGSSGCVVIRSMIAGNESLEVTDVAIDGFGRAVLTGFYQALGQEPPVVERRFLTRLTENGTPDLEFAGGAAFLTLPQWTDHSDYHRPAAVRIDAQGRIVLLSTVSLHWQSSDYDLLLQRFDDGGSPDPGFASNGTRVISFDVPGDLADSGRDLELLADGRLLVLGRAGGNAPKIALVRFDADATQIDPGFNGGAVRIEEQPSPLPLDPAELVVDDLGRSYIVAEGGTFPLRQQWVLRHRDDGLPDPDFGDQGRTEITGQALTGDATLNAFRIVHATLVGRTQLLVTCTLNADDILAKRAFHYALGAEGLFRDGFD